MSVSRLTWPEDRRLFRGARRAGRGVSAAAAVVAVALLLLLI